MSVKGHAGHPKKEPVYEGYNDAVSLGSDRYPRREIHNSESCRFGDVKASDNLLNIKIPRKESHSDLSGVED